MRARTTFAIVLFLACIAGPTTIAGAADCFRPCGSPLTGKVGQPSASDALETLKSAVGASITCYACECDVVGNGNGITATDALSVLRKAVGLLVTLACPACESAVAETHYERGRAAMEKHDLAWADSQFTCAINANPNAAIRSAVNTFGALAAVLHYGKDNPELQDLFLAVGGTGSLDFYDFTAAFGHFDMQPIASIRAVVLEGLDDVLSESIARLAIAKADTEFVAQVTAKMLPTAIQGSSPSYDMDATDAAVFSAAFRLVRFAAHFTTRMYDDSTADELNEDSSQLCDSGFLSAHPQFFTVADNAAKLTARAELKAGLADLALALDLVDAEVDSQTNDLLVRDDLPSDQYARNEDVVVDQVLASIEASTPIATCQGESLSVRIGKIFDDPLNRSDLPGFYTDDLGSCKIDKETFPDLRFNQVFARDVYPDELEQMYADMYPLCRLP